jgi:hypothetical protein
MDDVDLGIEIAVNGEVVATANGTMDESRTITDISEVTLLAPTERSGRAWVEGLLPFEDRPW